MRGSDCGGISKKKEREVQRSTSWFIGVLGLKTRKIQAKFWLPVLNDFALNSVDGTYEHPWIPVEVLREIDRVLKA